MSSIPTELYYRLACSVLQVTGTVESTRDFDTGEPATSATSEVSLAVTADPRQGARVRLPEHHGSANHDVTIKLLDDGRLAAASGAATSILPDIISAGASILGFVGGVVRAVAAPGLAALPALATREAPPGEPPRPETPRERSAREKHEDAGRLEKAVVAIDELHDAVVSEAHAMATTSQPSASQRKLIGLQTAIAAAQQEVASIETRRQAWVDATYGTALSYNFSIPTDEVFTFEGQRPQHPPAQIEPSALARGSDAARDMLASLGVAVVDLTPPLASDPWTTEDATVLDDIRQDLERGERARGVFFRIARPATLALYAASTWNEDGAVQRLELNRIERTWALDASSRLGSVPLEGGGDLTASIEFSDGGAPKSVTVSGKSALATALSALSGAPEKLAGGLGQAKSAMEAWNALGASRTDREIAALEARKKQLDAVIATRGLEADATHTETLQTLKDRLERLKTEKEIGTVTAPAPVASEPDRHAAEREQELARLRVELGIAYAQARLAALDDHK